MCGILGFITEKPSEDNLKMFRKILLLSETRGSDATGMAFQTQKNKFVIAKKAIAARDFIKDELIKYKEALVVANVAIGHTRTPTQGSPKDNNNNHPVESDNWILVHNGSVTQMPRIKEYKYKGEVDSEILVSYIESMGIEKALPYVERGTASIAVINKNEPNTLYLWREANPMYLAYDDKSRTIFFASDDKFLEVGLANKLLFFSSFQIRKLPENLLVKITLPLKMTNMGVIEVMKYNSQAHTTYASGWPSYTPPSSSVSLKEITFNNVTKRWEREVIGDNKDPQIIDCFYYNKDKSCFRGNRFSSIGAPCPPVLSTCPDYMARTGYTPCRDRAVTTIPSTLDASTKMLLKNKGFTEEQVNRMNDGCRATILYVGYDSTQVDVTVVGSLIVKAQQNTNKPSNNRYYIGGMSHDFTKWTKLTEPNKGHISIDAELYKKWDKDKKSHFVMLLEDAIQEKLVDEQILSQDIDFVDDKDENLYKTNLGDFTE